MNDQQITKYEFKIRRGIDDLRSPDPWAPAGDMDQWPQFHAYWGVTDEEYQADRKGYEAKVQWWNELYVITLKENGDYGRVDVHTLSIVYNPLFDSPPSLMKDKPPLSSYRMMFIDNSDYND